MSNIDRRFVCPPNTPSRPPDGARGKIDVPRLSRAVREILIAIGEDPDREGLKDTPGRVARSYTELFAGLAEHPSTHLSRTFDQDSEDLVSLSGIEFTSLCEHHLLPVFGRAHVAYLPSGKRVVGLSKIARTVEIFARRPQLQERLTAQIADAVMDHLEPEGVVVVVEAEHMCMRMRGVGKRGAVMRTLAARGLFEHDATRRHEVLGLLGVPSLPSTRLPEEERVSEGSHRRLALITSGPATPWLPRAVPEAPLVNV